MHICIIAHTIHLSQNLLLNDFIWKYYRNYLSVYYCWAILAIFMTTWQLWNDEYVIEEVAFLKSKCLCLFVSFTTCNRQFCSCIDFHVLGMINLEYMRHIDYVDLLSLNWKIFMAISFSRNEILRQLDELVLIKRSCQIVQFFQSWRLLTIRSIKDGSLWGPYWYFLKLLKSW